MKKLATEKEKRKILGLIKKGKARWNGDVKLLSAKPATKDSSAIDFVEIRIGATWVRWRKGKQGNDGGFVLCWGAKGVGFGEVTFSKDKDNKLHVQSECMGREFVKKALAALVDSAKWDE